MNAKTKSAERYEAFQSGKCDRLMMAVGTVEAIGFLLMAILAATGAIGCYALNGQPSDNGNDCPPGAVNCFYSTGWDVGPEKDFGPHKDGTYFTKDGVLVKEDGAVWHNQDAVEQFCNLASDGKQICSSSSVCPASSTCAKEGLECFIGICEMPELCKQNAPDAPPVCWSFCSLAHKWNCGIDGVLKMILVANTIRKNTCSLLVYTLDGHGEFGFLGMPGMPPPFMSNPESPATSMYGQPSADGKSLHVWDTTVGEDFTCTTVQ